METQRTHDHFYLKEHQATTPKQYFQEALGHVRALRPDADRWLDIGCAAGDFLTYVRGEQFGGQVYGTDVNPDLLSEAQRRVPEGRFARHDINQDPPPIEGFPPAFDVVTMLGVHSIFDTDTWVTTLAGLIAPGGIAVVFGIFNPFGCDTLLQVRRDGSTHFESGWNSPSLARIQERVSTLIGAAAVHRFVPTFDLAPRDEDPLRSWTVPLASGERLITNGTRIIHDFHFLIGQRSR